MLLTDIGEDWRELWDFPVLPHYHLPWVSSSLQSHYHVLSGTVLEWDVIEARAPGFCSGIQEKNLIPNRSNHLVDKCWVHSFCYQRKMLNSESPVMPSLNVKNSFVSPKTASPSYVQKPESHQISRHLYEGVSSGQKIGCEIGLLMESCLHKLDSSSR